MNSDFTIAVHALVFLGHSGKAISSEGLADNICTNPARIRKVLGILGRSGLVETRKGYGGGYHAANGSESLTLKDVAQALDTHFVRSKWKSGDKDKDCLVASGMADVMADIYEDLNNTCMARLATITIGDINSMIFHKEMQGRNALVERG